MVIKVYSTSELMDSASAAVIVGQVKAKADSVVGLSTGRTTKLVHKAVCTSYEEEPFDVSQVTFFGLDEVMGVPKEYSGACYTMLKTEIIGPLGIPEENFLMLPTSSEDFPRSCWEFTHELAKRGGIDLLYLGLGDNGHLGFNQPGSPFGCTARTSYMMEELEQRIRRETGLGDDAPLGGVTLGIKDIMHSRKLVLGAKGKAKAAMVKAMIEGPVTEELPASVLQLHPDCTILLDSEAASMLTPGSYVISDSVL